MSTHGLTLCGLTLHLLISIFNPFSQDTGILQPKSVAQGRGADMGEEVGEEEGEGSRRRSSSKKHHHRDRRSSDGTRKKKHKSRHSTRDKDGDQT